MTLPKPSHPFELSSRLRTRGQRGQSTVEFALVFPVFLAVLALAFTVSSLLTSVIGLSGAARAGAIAAANDAIAGATMAQEVADATAAINGEEGCNGCYTAASTPNDPTTCTSTECVWITRSTDVSTNTTVELVHIQHRVVPFVPVSSKFTVQAQAGATP